MNLLTFLKRIFTNYPRRIELAILKLKFEIADEESKGVIWLMDNDPESLSGTITKINLLQDKINLLKELLK